MSTATTSSSRPHVRLPRRLVYGVVLLSIVPFLLKIFGLDVGFEYVSLPNNLFELSDQFALHRILHHAVLDSLVHTILEWSAVTAALFTFVVTITYYRATHEAVSLFIGAAILLTGIVDAFHILAANHMVGAAYTTSDFIAFTWSISRIFAAAMLLGTVLLLLHVDARDQRTIGRWFGGFVLMVLAVGGFAAYGVLFERWIPSSAFQVSSVIRRPWDLPPLVLFIICGLWAFPRYYKQYPSLFSQSLWLCALPHIGAQLHMVFGSAAAHDHDFIAAHVLKVVAYLVPISGLLLDYIHAHREAESSARALEESENRYRSLSQATFEGIVFMQGMQILDVNAQFEEMIGVAREKLVGRDLSDLAVPEDRAALREAISQRFLRYRDSYQEVRLDCGDGESLTVELRSRSIGRTPDQSLDQRYMLAVRDISQRRIYEEQLEARTAELMRANTDLEQFAYVASHDLRSPLRAIDNLSTWIADDLGEDLPQDTAQHIALLRGRVARMERLLTDLLEFSRAGRRQVELEEVDVTALLDEIWSLLDHPPQFRLEFDPAMPRFVTARTPLQQVLYNLVGNAIKHHDRADGTVRVTAAAADAEDAWAFGVEDDGPGIEPKFHDNVFQIFETLRPRDEVEGSGMGLALVKRIVQNAGGTIRLDSPLKDGRGTRFVFTWPKNWKE